MFEKNVLYKSGDPKLLTIAKRQTWSAWRWRGTGPQFLRIGGRVFYRGEALNAWLERNTKSGTKTKTLNGAAA